MKLEDWQQIEDLFHEALKVEAGRRPAYLASLCAGNESLRAEVESLLTAFESEHSLMEQPALSLGMKILSSEATGTLVGQTIGSYKAVRLLGRGGMGEVYLAEDLKLGRNVALKFFTSRVDDVWARRQLTKEARAVASLEHPNICAVHGVEEIAGYDFIVMQYIEGETLASLMSKGLLALDQALGLAMQIVGALAAAHAHGVIHRDIKPQNIMVTADGQTKVLDFGLAKVVQQTRGDETAAEGQSQISQAGLIAGTVPYMSPEQLRAEALDFRTDIFSVGVLLYELIGGKNPYKQGSDAETISAILTSRPPPLAHPSDRTPPALNAIIQRCLEKDKDRRYHSAGELLSALHKLQDAPRARVHFGRRVVAGLALLLLLMLAGMSFTYLRLARAPAGLPPAGGSDGLVAGRQGDSPTKYQTLAVLPFIDESADPSAEYIGSGLKQSLLNQLSRLSKLHVKAPSAPGSPGGDFDPQKMGRDLKADAVLTGRITKPGGALTLHTVLVNTADGATLWEAEYPVETLGMRTLHREIAESVAVTLLPSLSKEEKEVLTKAQTENPEAYRFYLLGRHYWDKRDREHIQTAISYFTQATEIDPLYAQAWAGLADSYVLLPTVAYGAVPTKDAMPKARAAARKALQIDDTLCEAHISLGVVRLKYDWDWPEAEREFKRAIELNPDNASAHYWYSLLLAVTGRSSEVIAESETAKELDPLSPLIVMNLGRAYYRTRDYDRAVEYLRTVLEEKPNNVSALYVLGYVYLKKALYGEAIEIFEKISSTNKWLAAAPLGYAYARVGRKPEALGILDEMDKQKDVPAQERAIVYIGLGDNDRAFSWLEKSYEERFGSIIALTSDPIFDELRLDPRFAVLARKINLTP